MVALKDLVITDSGPRGIVVIVCRRHGRETLMLKILHSREKAKNTFFIFKFHSVFFVPIYTIHILLYC